MDLLMLSRLQFAITTVYHFFFVPLTLGLSVMVALMETIYVITNQEVYKRMTKFWGKLFLINFAMGVVTGIVQEFQFGMISSHHHSWIHNSSFLYHGNQRLPFDAETQSRCFSTLLPDRCNHRLNLHNTGGFNWS